MPKLNLFKIGLSLMLIILSLCFGGTAMAGDCENCGVPQIVTGEFNYAPGWFPELQYDPNNPKLIIRGESKKLKVIGGRPPYTWVVSGTGFSLSNTAETYATENTLIAGASACGVAVITVTGYDDTSDTGRVKCTFGTWVRCDPGFLQPENNTYYAYGCSGDVWVSGIKYHPSGIFRSSIVPPGHLFQNCSSGGDAITTCGIHGDVLLSYFYGFTPKLNISPPKAAWVSYWGCQ